MRLPDMTYLDWVLLRGARRALSARDGWIMWVQDGELFLTRGLEIYHVPLGALESAHTISQEQALALSLPSEHTITGRSRTPA